MPADVAWPRKDYSRVPFWLHHDEDLYALEMERIFRGPAWSYLCLEAELPKPCDYRSTWVGDTPVIVSRAKDGAIHAFVNRCSHRGAMIVRELRGNAERLVCLYHRWCYSNAGELTGLPFRKGLKGEGGMPEDFDMQAVSPQRLRVTNCHGMLFGTFSESAEPLEAYLGEFGVGMIQRFLARPIRILGYSRQRIAGNWKLYAENLRDTYHASLLHEFFVTYGVDRATQKGGVKMDARHRHNMNHAYAASDSDEDAKTAYADTATRLDRMRLRDQKLLKFHDEFPDGMNLAAPTFFPNALLIQINNTLGTRQIRPKGPGAHEVFQTLFGYADDDAAMTRHRLISANLVGPAGFVSMEDGEAIEAVQKATRSSPEGCAVIEMGGRGPVADQAHRVTEAPIRGFWSYWAELMGVEPVGGIR
ncbi:MAG: 3-phenylpropionate dioxygenase [Betaproteobacteria bacterium]|nr:3-phenylpropionate dioxygenase [Betaproteobacteria bacterium]